MSARKRCDACGGAYQSPGRRALIERGSAGGGRTSGRVCPKCERAGLLVCTTAASAPCGQCGDPSREASLCAACANDNAFRAARLILEPFADYLAKLALVARTDGRAGEAEGLEQAADILREARAVSVPRVSGAVS